jgi:hypothetical protein
VRVQARGCGGLLLVVPAPLILRGAGHSGGRVGGDGGQALGGGE